MSDSEFALISFMAAILIMQCVICHMVSNLDMERRAGDEWIHELMLDNRRILHRLEDKLEAKGDDKGKRKIQKF